MQYIAARFLVQTKNSLSKNPMRAEAPHGQLHCSGCVRQTYSIFLGLHNNNLRDYAWKSICSAPFTTKASVRPPVLIHANILAVLLFSAPCYAVKFSKNKHITSIHTLSHSPLCLFSFCFYSIAGLSQQRYHQYCGVITLSENWRLVSSGSFECQQVQGSPSLD